MRLFAQTYPDFEIRAQAVREMPWGHIVLILHKAHERAINDILRKLTIRSFSVRRSFNEGGLGWW